MRKKKLTYCKERNEENEIWVMQKQVRGTCGCLVYERVVCMYMFVCVYIGESGLRTCLGKRQRGVYK